jgi:endopeptidase La
MEKKKNNKYHKSIFLFYKKITLLNNQLEFLFKNKFMIQEIYMDKMLILNEIHNKIINLEEISLKKRPSKVIIENLIKEINSDIEINGLKIGSVNSKETLDLFISSDDFLSDKSIEYKDLFELLNNYFIPLSCNMTIENDKFIKKHDIKNFNLPIVHKLLDYSKVNSLIERINGASIIFLVNNKIIYINGYFNKDSLNIFKNYGEYKEKINIILEKMEYIEAPTDFKEKYIDQISLRDFILYTPEEIINIFKSDYNDFLSYKNKSLSSLIKEFIKSNIEKQRRIITLFLISDQEYQFTAHIIFDLITDKSFLVESQNLSDILFNSLHWKIQKIFKISSDNFENNKKKLENISINNVPYESRIMSIKVNDNIKAKAMEKLKEINGSKESSVKAQQWLDGFLKIPFNVSRKEPIIEFFKNFQIKIEKYIEVFTIKVSEYNIDKLNQINKNVYTIITQVIDEYHSNITKSEYSYNNFIKYLEMIKITIETEMNIKNNSKLNNCINLNNNSNNNSNSNSKNNTDELFLMDNLGDNETIINQIIENNIIPSEENINECIKQLNHFKKIKIELSESTGINDNQMDTMVQKLNDIESLLNINLLKNNDNINKDELGNLDELDELDELNESSGNYNNIFKKYIMKNLDNFSEFINEWNTFKTKKREYMKDVDKILDKCTYGQVDAKKQMKRIIGQWMNGTSKGQCFGLCGPPGVGKTTLCKNGLAKCLFDDNGESRPFAFLPLGGATNGSILEGHHYTYLGSTWGKIVDIMMETKCMNPIIYIDELDKISKTEHGKEIASILTHITDQSQNKEFYDRYFSSIPIDLSQVLFIFSYNDRDNIDRILRDRIQEITIKPLSLPEKLVISQNYITPEILQNVGFSNMEVVFTNDILTKIINHYTYEAGVRKLNEILYDIIREINLKKIEDEEDRLEYPIIIDEKITDDVLSNIPKVVPKKIDGINRVGSVNGMYATTSGLGGLTPVQVYKTVSDKKFSLERLTGSLGDVMKESMSCALTLAWNILPENIKKEISDNKDGYGLHIHCGDGGTKKDGPSAGAVLTTAIISRITNIPARNDVAMTGEIDLQGNVCEIGGLYSKIQGAYTAGIKKIIVPRDNEKDLDIIFKKEEEEFKEMKKVKSQALMECFTPNTNNFNGFFEDESNYIKKRIFRNEVEIYTVSTIFEVLNHVLVKNDLIFNKIF